MTTEIAEINFLDFKCPHCGELNSFPQDAAGRVRECVNCMEGLIVPGAGGEVGLKVPLPITTPRLVLRRLVADDWKDLLEFMFDDEEEATRWLENDRKVKLTTLDQTFSLGVEVRDTGKIVGCLGLRFTDGEFIEAEVSVTGYDNDQDNGSALEAAAAVFGFCFDGLKLHRVIARCLSSDTAGCQFFENAGMRREGEFVKHYRVSGEWVNTIYFAVLDEEYLESGSNPPAESLT